MAFLRVKSILLTFLIMIKKIKQLFNKYPALAFIGDILLNLVIIIGLVFIIRNFLISPFEVFGPSMCDTLNNINGECQQGHGEYIIVNKAIYGNFFGLQVGKPKRGDIIVFHPPLNDKEFFIKRVIGLPGETVKLANGYVYIINQANPEGYKLEEPYLSAENLGNTHPSGQGDTIYKVPENEYFALGDNRLHSSDSRTCFKEYSNQDCGKPGATPYLKPIEIEGKAWLVLWPISKLESLKDPAYGI